MEKTTKTLLIEQTSGQPIRAEVPIKATVTFGGLIPGAKVDGGSNRTALRVYMGKEQIAVFTGVQSFRFIESVTILEKRVQQAYKNIIVEENGIQKNKSVTVSTEDWVNPDAVKEPQPSNEAGLMFKQLSIEST